MGSSGVAIDMLMSLGHWFLYCWPGAPVKLRRGVAMPAHPAALLPLAPCARDDESLRARPSLPR